ncbi:MAG: hypothetical protein K2X28_07370 [Alphaproteobacteria bacterium]|nr:hypothetical protein [Alphaproteobacteria bacterium]
MTRSQTSLEKHPLYQFLNVDDLHILRETIHYESHKRIHVACPLRTEDRRITFQDNDEEESLTFFRYGVPPDGKSFFRALQIPPEKFCNHLLLKGTQDNDDAQELRNIFNIVVRVGMQSLENIDYDDLIEPVSQEDFCSYIRSCLQTNYFPLKFIRAYQFLSNVKMNL